MYYIIDRFEDEFAVIEDENRKYYNIPRILVSDCSEGDRILIKKDKSFIKNELNEKFENLFVD